MAPGLWFLNTCALVVSKVTLRNQTLIMMTRRHALKTTAIVAATAATLPSALAQPSPEVPEPGLITSKPIGPFTLPPLPYAVDALEPHIDARTMEIHHDRHHKTYVDNLNKALADFPMLEQKPIDGLLEDLNSVPEKIRTAVRNQGGGHYNHSLFWQMMKKDGGGEPKAELAQAIERSFGNFSGFKTKFTEAATRVFGSGWVWLVATAPNAVAIETTPNQDSPILPAILSKEAEQFLKDQGLASSGQSTKHPLLGLDVWEHAYYLKYQNKRADYVNAWWNVVNWDFVAERYAKLKG